MKVPPKRKGNLGVVLGEQQAVSALKESPSEKEGKFPVFQHREGVDPLTLNESPSEKEGKLPASRSRRVAYLRPQ